MFSRFSLARMAGLYQPPRRLMISFPALTRRMGAVGHGLCLLALLLFPALADAHGAAGPRVFVSTPPIDDPNVAGEASLPTFFWRPRSAPVPQLSQGTIEERHFDDMFPTSLGKPIVNWGRS